MKPGHEAEFKAGMRKQIEWYKRNSETWQWHAWQWETGEKTGQYVFRSPGHYWKDLDDRSERTARASAHFEEVITPHVESVQASIGKVLPDVSNWPEDLGMVPMVSVYEFNIHYGMSEDFLHAIGKINAAIKESNWGVHYVWIVRESGGEVPVFALVIPHKNWADMEGPEKPLWTMMEETPGSGRGRSAEGGAEEMCTETEFGAGSLPSRTQLYPAGRRMMIVVV